MSAFGLEKATIHDIKIQPTTALKEQWLHVVGNGRWSFLNLIIYHLNFSLCQYCPF